VNLDKNKNQHDCPENRSENWIDEKNFDSFDYKKAKEHILKHFNTAYIGQLLTKTNGNVTQAAKACGLERQSLQQIMRRYYIRAEEFR